MATASVAGLCVLAITACGGSTTPATTRATPSAPNGPLPQKTVQAHRLRPDSPNSVRIGTRVGSPLGVRIFANPQNGFALGAPRRDFGATYPIATVDGGKTWRTAGPVLHIPAAQAAVDVTEPGMYGPRVWFAWGPGISVVDVTPDAGKHWWQAALPGMVLTVYAPQTNCKRLIALVQPFTKRKNAPIWAYASANGRTWRYGADPNAAGGC
jgi:hypothetical protein